MLCTLWALCCKLFLIKQIIICVVYAMIYDESGTRYVLIIHNYHVFKNVHNWKGLSNCIYIQKKSHSKWNKNPEDAPTLREGGGPLNMSHHHVNGTKEEEKHNTNNPPNNQPRTTLPSHI